MLGDSGRRTTSSSRRGQSSRDFDNVGGCSSHQFSCSVCFEFQPQLGLLGNVPDKLFSPASKQFSKNKYKNRQKIKSAIKGNE